MPDTKMIPSYTLALAGLVLAYKPDSITTALAFIAAAALFGWLQYLERIETKKSESVDEQLRIMREKVELLSLKIGLNR